jgi:uncharacterized protein
MDSAFLLSLFTVLLFLRVIGQIIVVLRAPRWLPPMAQWQSGLLPYPVLLAAQAVVLTLMVWISANFVRRSGVFFEPQRPGVGYVIVSCSRLYFGGMVVRYIVRMWRRPDQRWLGGTIPIVFHSIVAAFLWIVGRYHLSGVR